MVELYGRFEDPVFFFISANKAGTGEEGELTPLRDELQMATGLRQLADGRRGIRHRSPSRPAYLAKRG